MNTKVVIGIVIFVILAVGGFFAMSYFSGSSQPTDTLQQAGYAPDVTTGSNSTTSALTGREFVRTLVNLQSLKLNDQLFSDPAFMTLVDFSVPLQAQPMGRPNPFAPIGTDPQTANIASSLGTTTITNQPR